MTIQIANVEPEWFGYNEADENYIQAIIIESIEKGIEEYYQKNLEALIKRSEYEPERDYTCGECDDETGLCPCVKE